MKKTLAIIRHDPWLEPYSDAINGRHDEAVRKEKELAGKGGTLVDFANAHKYFGLHKTRSGWAFREWAPNATAVYLIGSFNNWTEKAEFALTRIDGGVWEITLPKDVLRHGDLYKLKVHWDGGCGERIPAYSTRTVQDEKTLIFSAQVWQPARPYKFKVADFKPQTNPLLIYECHIGMGEDKEGVGTYEEFRVNVLPRIEKDGYNAIQIMAIQEHPYYGSFGYHVSSFYAASSRFGTPDELKRLIDDAHSRGIAVIMDIVHSHAVKNEVEGLGRFDGNISTATRAANIQHGTRSASTTARTKCFTSCCRTASSGLKSIISTDSASTVSRRCSTTTTDSVRHSRRMTTTTTADRTQTQSHI